ncbi:MAG: hypothetical protein ACJ76H_01680 [Bacteriovoracaceae bacterium]
MRTYYFFILLLFPVISGAQPVIKVMEEPRSLEDFEHQNKGCPANSECDPVMGHQMKNWTDLVKALRDDDKKPQLKKIEELEAFRAKAGIPAEFYTYKKSQQGFRPLYFNSPCKDHNPKKDDDRVLRGIAFIKSLTKEKAKVWRDQAEMEVPVGPLLIPQPITIYSGTTIAHYTLPIDEQPLFIKDKALYIVKEEEGFYYVLKVEQTGEWKIVDLDLTRLSEWEDKREYVPCPSDKEKKITPKEFGVTFCKSVWDEDAKKTVVVKMHAGCNA